MKCICSRIGIMLLAFILFFGGSAAVFAWGNSDRAQVSALISAGQKEDLAAAVGILQTFLATDSEDAEILCLLAEAHFYYGDWLEGEEQPLVWEQGQEYAEQALSLDPQSADAYYWIAALMGKIGRARGILKSLFLVNPMFENLNSALTINPDYSWAYFVLSHLYDQTPPKPLGRGDRRQALVCARTAWELEPDEPEFVLQYAAMLSKEKETAKALEILNQALECDSQKWTPDLRAEAVRLTGKLEKSR